LLNLIGLWVFAFTRWPKDERNDNRYLVR
jgi:hypothetical protein